MQYTPSHIHGGSQPSSDRLNFLKLDAVYGQSTQVCDFVDIVLNAPELQEVIENSVTKKKGSLDVAECDLMYSYKIKDKKDKKYQEKDDNSDFVDVNQYNRNISIQKKIEREEMPTNQILIHDNCKTINELNDESIIQTHDFITGMKNKTVMQVCPERVDSNISCKQKAVCPDKTFSFSAKTIDSIDDGLNTDRAGEMCKVGSDCEIVLSNKATAGKVNYLETKYSNQNKLEPLSKCNYSRIQSESTFCSEGFGFLQLDAAHSQDITDHSQCINAVDFEKVIAGYLNLQLLNEHSETYDTLKDTDKDKILDCDTDTGTMKSNIGGGTVLKEDSCVERETLGNLDQCETKTCFDELPTNQTQIYFKGNKMCELNDENFKRRNDFIADMKNETAIQIFHNSVHLNTASKQKAECPERTFLPEDIYAETVDIIGDGLDTVGAAEVGKCERVNDLVQSNETLADKNNAIRTVYMKNSGSPAELVGKANDSRTKDLNRNNQE